jgi:transcriptional regulator with PAS, ATPase and Fis domain
MGSIVEFRGWSPYLTNTGEANTLKPDIYHPTLIGVSPDIEKIRKLVVSVADLGLNVLITGETGVGKEVVARMLYRHSPRFGRPFVKVNCAALPDDLLESELYGYEKGAFTGAQVSRKGKFELSHKGVLFLDEIGDMALAHQAKLLHALQDGEFSPLGSEREIMSDSWVIAATNHDLKEKIASRSFRADLFYRLNIVGIHIPPLRNRPEDIEALIDHFTREFVDLFGAKPLKKLSGTTRSILHAYHWPGNVRQLQNILKRLLILGEDAGVLDELTDNVSETNRFDGRSAHRTAHGRIPYDFEGMGFHTGSNFALKDIRKKALERIDYDAIHYALTKTNGNRSRAAHLLQVSYKTLLEKITELNLP